MSQTNLKGGRFNFVISLSTGEEYNHRQYGVLVIDCSFGKPDFVPTSHTA
jgi:hypothetical protein